ncbi:MAG: NAD(P)-binding domain-containing protein [Rhodobacteraceae bacterium]|nr:NAD(P)-binding domain-containing protein [Paracoccaceae bacterium]MCY4137190.1 NAD(P)-binding domain-containing protein [Paracoccaceae bacterium]
MGRIAKDDVIVIGAGQAGLCASCFLSGHGIEHVVLEAGRIGESWRSQRWDSFCLVTPNWTVKLPGMSPHADPDGFMPCSEFVAFMEGFAGSFSAPVETSTKVTAIRRGRSGARFEVQTSRGTRCCDVLIICCGMYQSIRRPAVACHVPADINQIDVCSYRKPDELADGSVLVVGSGQSGAQVAEEVRDAGREVYLCVGRAGRIPRRYRGRDLSCWQFDMGYLDRTPDQLESPADRFRGDPHVSGLNGGHTLNLHQFLRDGIKLLGSLEHVSNGTIGFADNLETNMRAADAFADAFCRSVDSFIRDNGIDVPPPDDDNSDFGGGNGDYPATPRDLILRDAGIRTIIWATGFGFDFSWVDFSIFDEFGYPYTRRGVTEVDGLYFLGLNWLHTRKSGIILGAAGDARHVVEHVRRNLGSP